MKPLSSLLQQLMPVLPLFLYGTTGCPRNPDLNVNCGRRRRPKWIPHGRVHKFITPSCEMYPNSSVVKPRNPKTCVIHFILVSRDYLETHGFASVHQFWTKTCTAYNNIDQNKRRVLSSKCWETQLPWNSCWTHLYIRTALECWNAGLTKLSVPFTVAFCIVWRACNVVDLMDWRGKSFSGWHHYFFKSPQPRCREDWILGNGFGKGMYTAKVTSCNLHSNSSFWWDWNIQGAAPKPQQTN